MAQGLERRQVVQDTLRGQEALPPVTRQMPSTPSPVSVQAPRDTFTQQIVGRVNEFVGGAMQEAQVARQKKSIVDGQIKAMQGESFEAVEMEGNKWALEGYRGVVAQTMSASLLRAQENEIAQGLYEQDPETYRSRLVDRIDAMTSEIPDQRTRDLATESLMGQMPILVDTHTKQHLGFKEQQNFDALSGSVDVLSRDGQSAQSLVAFATGAAPETQGLSQARRTEAVTQGVVQSFHNGNPAAYAHLEKSGFLSTDNLSMEQLNKIESAKAAWQSRNEQEWSQEYHTENRRITDAVQRGELTGPAAAEQYIANRQRNGRRVDGQAVGAVFDAAEAGVEYDQGTRGINIQIAGEQGDYNTQAQLLQGAVIKQESGGRADAVSPKGATGIMQLMPATAANPGYGIRNIFQVARDMGRYNGQSAATLMRDPEVNKAMGTEYLAKMLELNNGDVELALISYNAGLGRANEFKAAGRNWDNISGSWKHESRDYVAKITGTIQDGRPDPEGARQMAQNRLDQVRSDAKIATYEASYPELNANEQDFRSGLIDQQTYAANNREIFNAYGREVDMQWLQAEAAISNSVTMDIQKRSAEGIAEQNELAYVTALAPLDQRWSETQALAAEGSISQEEVSSRFMAMTQERQNLMTQFGITPTASGEGATRRNQTTQAVEAIRQAQAGQERRVIRETATARGMANTLPASEQALVVKNLDRQLREKYANLAAQGTYGPDFLEENMATERSQGLARAGLVDDFTKRTINAGLQQNPMTEDGELNPAFVEAVQSYNIMKQVNPATADKYIDIETRGTIDSIMARVPDQGNIEAAVYSYGQQYQRALAGGGTFQTREEFLADPSAQRAISQEVDRFVSSFNVTYGRELFGSVTTAPSGMAGALDPTNGQWRNRYGFDSDAYRDAITPVMEAEVARIQANTPWVKPAEIVAQAGERVKRRYAIVGDAAVDFGTDIYEQTFGNRANEMMGNDDAINAAVMTYLRSPEFTAQHPESTGVTFMENATRFFGGPANETRRTGVRPFEVFPVADGRGGVAVQIVYERRNGGRSVPVTLDMSRVGETYLNHIRNNNR